MESMAEEEETVERARRRVECPDGLLESYLECDEDARSTGTNNPANERIVPRENNVYRLRPSISVSEVLQLTRQIG